MKVATQRRSGGIIELRWTREDVLAIAGEKGIPESVALDRAEDWAKHIADTANGIIAEQLTSVVELNTP